MPDHEEGVQSGVCTLLFMQLAEERVHSARWYLTHDHAVKLRSMQQLGSLHICCCKLHSQNGAAQQPCLQQLDCVQHSHIVAIKTSGNVFSHEAVHQFNVKMKSWRDLITDEPFTKQDIITVQVRLLQFKLHWSSVSTTRYF